MPLKLEIQVLSNSTPTRCSLRNRRGGSVSLEENSVRHSRQLAPSYPFLPTVQLHEESCEERPRLRNRALHACHDVDPAPSICRGPQHCAPQWPPRDQSSTTTESQARSN